MSTRINGWHKMHLFNRRPYKGCGEIVATEAPKLKCRNADSFCYISDALILAFSPIFDEISYTL